MAIEERTGSRAGTPATIEDVLRLAAEGDSYELVDGVLVDLTPPGFDHGSIEHYASWVLGNHVIPRRLGRVVTGDTLFRLDPAGRHGRAADIAFVRRDRLPPGGSEPGAFPGAPDFAIEVISPTDRAADVQEKVDQYLAHGTEAVLLMYPTGRVVLWRAGGAVELGAGDQLDLDFVVPGFAVRVGELFPSELGEE